MTDNKTMQWLKNEIADVVIKLMPRFKKNLVQRIKVEVKVLPNNGIIGVSEFYSSTIMCVPCPAGVAYTVGQTVEIEWVNDISLAVVI